MPKPIRITQPLIATDQADPFGVLSTQNGPNLDYAGNCAREPPSLAVAVNCGMGSSFLKALVNAFERLHMVLAENSGYCGSKYQLVDLGEQASWSFQLAVDERRVVDQLRRVSGDLRLPPQFNLALHRLKVALDAVHSD
jgi:hypothetical protein